MLEYWSGELAVPFWATSLTWPERIFRCLNSLLLELQRDPQARQVNTGIWLKLRPWSTRVMGKRS